MYWLRVRFTESVLMVLQSWRRNVLHVASLVKSTDLVLESSVDLPCWVKAQPQGFTRAKKATKNKPVLALPLPTVVNATSVVWCCNRPKSLCTWWLSFSTSRCFSRTFILHIKEIAWDYSLNTMFRGGEDFCLKVENNRKIKEEAETKLVTSTSNFL